MAQKSRHVKKTAPASSGKVNPERLEAMEFQRRRELITWGVIIGAFIILSLLFWMLVPKGSPHTSFAKCLSKEGAIMYGTDTCSACQAQKRLFGTAFKEINYVNCGYSTQCQAQEITGYPTWILIDGERLVGKQELNVLAEKTGCALN